MTSFISKKAGISIFLVIITAQFLYSENLPAPFMLIPQPKEVILTKGGGLKYGSLKQIMLKGDFSRPVMGEILSRLPVSDNAGRGTLWLVLDSNSSIISSDEGYQLIIRGDRVEISARTEAGLFYGCQSLEQLLEDSRDYNRPVPACRINDYPVLSYRAVHFDVKHHLDQMNYYYESIDRLARYKINAVVFEFEDKLRYRRQPLVGASQSISIDEMAALTRYARARNIEITPLVQGLGHATFILKHEAYAGLRELIWNNWAFCPLHEGTYQVLFDLYRDAIDATPGSKYLHIGGDEIGNIGLCPRCKPMADKEGLLSLSLYWLKRVCEFAEENGRIPVFWDDMPLKHGEVYESTWSDDINEEEAEKAWNEGAPKLDNLLRDFPKNCVYMRWNYSMARQPGNIKALDWYQSRGLKAMIATATNAEGGILFQEEEREIQNSLSGIITIRSFIKLAAEKGIYGMLCTAWDDKSPHMENYWRGFIASAEYSWSPDGRRLEEFDDAWMQREFGISIPDYLSLNSRLRRGSVLWYEAYYRKGNRLDDESALQSLPRLEHWLPPLPYQEKMFFDYTSKLIELPDPDKPGSWSLKYKDRIDRAQTEVNDQKYLTERLEALMKSSKKNRYYWELSQALYDLQMSAPQILLALRDSDDSDMQKRNEGYAKVKEAVNNFWKTWDTVKQAYEKTRFVSYPPGYVPDRYFHVASQREDLSWMIQAEELFLEMVNKWLPV